MFMDEILSISGGKELAEFLNSLPVKIERNIMRAALRAGARVIANEAKNNVPVKMGGLKRSIRTDSTRTKGGVEATAKAGGRSGGKSKDKSAFYAQFVEYGTAAHLIKAGERKKRLVFTARDGNRVSTMQVNHPGATAKPFMRPALDSKKDEAMRAVTDKIKERLTREGINVVAPEGSE